MLGNEFQRALAVVDNVIVDFPPKTTRLVARANQSWFTQTADRSVAVELILNATTDGSKVGIVRIGTQAKSASHVFKRNVGGGLHDLG